VRGVTFGIGGAVLGMILYAAVGILTGLMIGYVALAVGYVVAKAIKMCSGGMGGRRYQFAAALLTYAAVSIAAVPIGISQYVKARDARVAAAHAQRLQNPSTEAPNEDASSADAKRLASSPDPPPATRSTTARHPTDLSGVLGSLLLAGLLSPFMDFWNNGPSIRAEIGLFILFIGIRIAWQMTGGSGTTSVIGPFKS
jgi:hypothetical protein